MSNEYTSRYFRVCVGYCRVVFGDNAENASRQMVQVLRAAIRAVPMIVVVGSLFYLLVLWSSGDVTGGDAHGEVRRQHMRRRSQQPRWRRGTATASIMMA
jgi:hypothetical protein